MKEVVESKALLSKEMEKRGASSQVVVIAKETKIATL